MVWSCLPFTRSGKKHLARHSEREKKTRQTEKEVGRQHQGMDFLVGVEFGKSQRAVEKRENWRKLVVKRVVKGSVKVVKNRQLIRQATRRSVQSD